MQRKYKIVFFDGVCGLCNKWVDFLLKIDSKQTLKFSPLQGETAAKLLTEEERKSDSIIYKRDDQTHTKSTAILNILSDIGGLWTLLNISKIIPKKTRDWLYDKVAKNRYKLFKKSNSCRLPKKEEKNRFLP